MTLLVTAVSVIGTSASASNVFLNALAYTGYNLAKVKNDSRFMNDGSRGWQEPYLNSIYYGTGCTGLEVTSGKKPNLEKFQSGGLCCAS